MPVACLGPEGSFSHEFANTRFPEANFVYREQFDEVIDLVKDGTCQCAVLPFLNSNGVDVRPVQATLGKNRDWARVVGCYPHKVVHNVVVGPDFVSLRKLVSKEQVFPQCSNWLGQWKSMEIENAPSTSAALLELLKSDLETRKSTGAICNNLAHSLYGGKIWFPRIENPGNTTLFLVVSKQEIRTWDDQLLICLTCPTEECYKSATNDFASAGFPIKFSSLKGEFTWELLFFLELANIGDRSKLLDALEKPHRHLIGTFPTSQSLSACIVSFFEHDYLDDEV